MNLPNGYLLQNGKYALTKVIGQGGFGITYLGIWNTEVKGELGTVQTDVSVCIKEYFFKDYCFRDQETYNVQVHSETGKILFEKFKEKLIKEAKILSEVHHPYIVNVLEVFEENNTAYIAMEHISGCSLKYMLDVEGVLPEKKVLKYIFQIGQALDFVHQKNILHLDIKPSNILIDKNDNARLIDFGVSKRYDIEKQETSTTTLTLSKGFAPIEQYDDEGTQNFSPCPDIYSLGATMYNLLTGEVPTESILRATKSLIKPSELNKDITTKTETVILTAMQVDPMRRYQSVKAMVYELDIPSYFEETLNLLTEESGLLSVKDEESTEIYTNSKLSQLIDEEQTVVRFSTVLSQHIRKKKRKRRILIPLLIFVFVFIGGAVAYIFDLNESRDKIQVTNLVADVTKGTEPVLKDANLEVPLLSLEENKKEVTEVVIKPEQTEAVKPAANNKTESKQPVTNPNILPENNAINPSSEQIDAEYLALIGSGKTKMEQKNYLGAKVDFEKAKDLKVTEEVLRLSITCEEKEEEKKIIERKALYEEIMSFGNYSIVRKKSTGRYGAIDSKGQERIKSVYLSVGRSENGRAFEREDHLYDIYNVNGVLVGNGLTSY